MEFAENDAKHRGELVAPATFVFSENKGHDYEHMRSYFENLNFQNRYSTMHLKPKRWISEFLRSEEHTSELQSLMRISYAVFCLKKKKTKKHTKNKTKYVRQKIK